MSGVDVDAFSRQLARSTLTSTSQAVEEPTTSPQIFRGAVVPTLASHNVTDYPAIAPKRTFASAASSPALVASLPDSSRFVSAPVKLSAHSSPRHGERSMTPSAIVSRESASSGPIDEAVMQAMRKPEDRIFFIQHEHQMSAFVQETARRKLELPLMNSYQRLLTHRCADQFRLAQQFDRSHQTLSLLKTPDTAMPPELLSILARRQLATQLECPSTSSADDQTDQPHRSTDEKAVTEDVTTVTSDRPSSTTLTHPSSSQSSSSAPFRIMRRDPSSSRSVSQAASSGNNSESEKGPGAPKSRKDMTIQEREAAYKLARARIFGDSDAPPSSTTSSSAPSVVDERATDRERDSTNSSAASSPAQTTTAAGGRKNATSGQDSSSASRTRSANTGNRAKQPHSHQTATVDDDWEYSRALPLSSASCASSSSSSSSAVAWPQQPSPLAFPGPTAGGYFAGMAHVQQSHSNPNLRAKAPAFHPPGSSTPSYTSSGAVLRPTGPPSHRYTDSGAGSRRTSASSSQAPSPAGSVGGSRNTSTSSTGHARAGHMRPYTDSHGDMNGSQDRDHFPVLAASGASRAPRAQSIPSHPQQHFPVHTAWGSNKSSFGPSQMGPPTAQNSGVCAWAQQTAIYSQQAVGGDQSHTHTSHPAPPFLHAQHGGPATTFGYAGNWTGGNGGTAPPPQLWQPGGPAATQVQIQMHPAPMAPALRRLSSSTANTGSRPNSIRSGDHTYPRSNSQPTSRDDAASVGSAASSSSRSTSFGSTSRAADTTASGGAQARPNKSGMGPSQGQGQAQSQSQSQSHPLPAKPHWLLNASANDRNMQTNGSVAGQSTSTSSSSSSNCGINMQRTASASSSSSSVSAPGASTPARQTNGVVSR
ncbi:hypothetical protein BCV70DRAFT_22057 [Testicularia cyperi]|uniref:SUZ domain-containing protein n=1 Tax=Testicularia cyperi TaxID=1882483 RepID=A0A317Y261_9BASI|nr:hypothetical protein BCV70DRAFT_22057 [Testicularia cyperi]